MRDKVEFPPKCGQAAFGGQKQSGRTWIIVLILIILLGIAGYFVWDYFNPESDDGAANGEVKTDQGISTEIVDDSWCGIDNNIALDSNNNPHISHYDQANRDLIYSSKTNGQWQNEIVDSEGDVGEASGVVIDEDENPHISYIDETNGGAKYATKIDGQWQIQVIETRDGYQAKTTSIAIDSKGIPHVAYNLQPENQGPALIRYAKKDGDSWEFEDLNINGTDVNLALDKNNNAHIVYKNTEDKITYANQANNWQQDNFDPETEAGGDSTIAVDSKDNPHIAYNDYGNSAKKYATKKDGSWEIETIAQNTGNNEGTKIALDKNDRPSITYTNENKEILVIASLKSDGFKYAKIDKMGISSIAIDKNNNFHVSYTRTTEDQNKKFSEALKQTGQKEIEILKYAKGNIKEIIETEIDTTKDKIMDNENGNDDLDDNQENNQGNKETCQTDADCEVPGNICDNGICNPPDK